jgi:chemotaxis protein methyltransferase CheR
MTMLTRTANPLRQLADTIGERFGLRLPEEKLSFVASRLGTMARTSGFASVEALAADIALNPSEDRLLAVFDALSTNVTSFFRDAPHFECLAREIYAPMRAKGGTPNIRLWSAACSTGAEPYSLAIHACDVFGADKVKDCQILASDLSQPALDAAMRAVYPDDSLTGISQEQLSKYVLRGTSKCSGFVKMSDRLRSMVTFKRQNLLDTWPWHGPFDAVFCRNVMIYFERPVRERLVRRMRSTLRPGGLLVLGSSESLSGLDVGTMRMVSPSVYRRVDP